MPPLARSVGRFVCPNCRNADGLWRGVRASGWEAVGDDLTPETFTGREMDREIYWELVEADGIYGCDECGWEGVRDGLIHLGIDGEPLPRIHPGQEALL